METLGQKELCWTFKLLAYAQLTRSLRQKSSRIRIPSRSFDCRNWLAMLSESSDSLKAKLAYASLREVACMNLLKEAYASLRALRDLLTQ